MRSRKKMLPGLCDHKKNSPLKKEVKVEGSKHDKGGVGETNKYLNKWNAEKAEYDKLPTWKKAFKSPPGVVTGYAPGFGGKGKSTKKLFDTFNKIAKNRKKQSRLIQESLEKKGYTFSPTKSSGWTGK